MPKTSLIGQLAALATGHSESRATTDLENPALAKDIQEQQSEVFARWLSLGLADQRADLDVYIQACLVSDLEDRLWPSHYRDFAPASAMDCERRLFMCDLAANLTVIRIERRLCQSPDWRVQALQETALSAFGNVRLSFRKLSQQFRISPNYLAQIFRRAAGIGFRERLRQRPKWLARCDPGS